MALVSFLKRQNMNLTKKQKAHNTSTSMVNTLTDIANEYKRILEKGTNNRGEVLGAPEDIKAAFGTEQMDAMTDFIKTWASKEEAAGVAAKPPDKAPRPSARR